MVYEKYEYCKQKKIKLSNKLNFVELKYEIMHHVLKCRKLPVEIYKMNF